MKAFVVAISCLLISAPAMAQTSGGVMSGSGAGLATGQDDLPENASTPGEDANGERRVCRRVETGSSSRMSTRRLCLTAREWREYNSRRR